MIYDRDNGNEQSTERSNNLIIIGYCVATENKLLKWGLSWNISLESDPSMEKDKITTSYKHCEIL